MNIRLNHALLVWEKQINQSQVMMGKCMLFILSVDGVFVRFKFRKEKHYSKADLHFIKSYSNTEALASAIWLSVITWQISYSVLHNNCFDLVSWNRLTNFQKFIIMKYLVLPILMCAYCIQRSSQLTHINMLF